MLEKVDLSLSVPKETYKRRIVQLQSRLYDLVHAAFQSQIPTMIVFEGWAAAGKGGTINLLTERLDPRGVRVVPISPPRSFETHYPWMWRYWQRLPAYGQTVIFDTSWYRRVLTDRVGRTVKKRAWREAYQDIVEFEAMLAAEGTLIRKFWLQISRKEQGRRFKKLLASKLTSWQVAGEDAAQHKAYDKYADAVEEMLARTDFPHAPWVIVEATDRYHTRIKVFEEIVRAFEERLAAHVTPARTPAGAVPGRGSAMASGARKPAAAKPVTRAAAGPSKVKAARKPGPRGSKRPVRRQAGRRGL
jgi:polyphosphate kinase 2 (PPK2 family)